MSLHACAVNCSHNGKNASTLMSLTCENIPVSPSAIQGVKSCFKIVRGEGEPGDEAIDRIGGAWLLTEMALFMISILHVNPHSLSDSNLEYGHSQPCC